MHAHINKPPFNNKIFSKLIPRKLAGFEIRVTENPRWQAPILRRNPMLDLFPIYE
jgi:hypothetical protein